MPLIKEKSVIAKKKLVALLVALIGALQIKNAPNCFTANSKFSHSPMAARSSML